MIRVVKALREDKVVEGKKIHYRVFVANDTREGAGCKVREMGVGGKLLHEATNFPGTFPRFHHRTFA